MKTIYLDCASGISGDMMLGALVDAGADLSVIQAGVASLGLPEVHLELTEVKRHAFRAAKISVQHPPEHAHRHLHHITDMIDASILSDPQKELAVRIFTRLGEAEATVHGTTLRKVHFHEVGAVDSIADIVGSAIGLDLLRPDRVVCSPVPTGSGFIQIAHGRCSVPAPATAELLKGVPLATSVVEAELTTPTGAAIVATIADSFGPLPPLTVERIGYGAGDNDFEEQANLLRLIVGTEATDAAGSDRVMVLETNLDQATGESIGFCIEQLFQLGALDVYTTAIQMKKGRPGVKLTVLCTSPQQASVEAVLFREARTLGIRRWAAERTVLERESTEVATPWGLVKGKRIKLPDGSERFAAEYEDCARIAREHGIDLQTVRDTASGS